MATFRITRHHSCPRRTHRGPDSLGSAFPSPPVAIRFRHRRRRYPGNPRSARCPRCPRCARRNRLARGWWGGRTRRHRIHRRCDASSYFPPAGCVLRHRRRPPYPTTRPSDVGGADRRCRRRPVRHRPPRTPRDRSRGSHRHRRHGCRLVTRRLPPRRRWHAPCGPLGSGRRRGVRHNAPCRCIRSGVDRGASGYMDCVGHGPRRHVCHRQLQQPRCVGCRHARRPTDRRIHTRSRARNARPCWRCQRWVGPIMRRGVYPHLLSRDRPRRRLGRGAHRPFNRTRHRRVELACGGRQRARATARRGECPRRRARRRPRWHAPP